MKMPELIYSTVLPSKSYFSSATILLYDQNLIKSPELKKWILRFPFSISLKAGENLKNFESYKNIVEKAQNLVVKHKLASSSLTFIAFGGGTVTDFVGFVASTFQRGKSFYIIPSTWLAAIDSAHGGKNGLNLNQVKNQIGTFHNAEKIFICRNIFKNLSVESLNDSYSEALKIGLIESEQLFLKLNKNFPSLWKNLPELVKSKNKIIAQDPFEKKGIRRILNLGHTMGHVFESIHSISHGQAVFLGLLFSLRFSLYKNYLKWSDFIKIIDIVFEIECSLSYQQALKINLKQATQLLAQDKKSTDGNKIDFIFIKKPGSVIREQMTIQSIINEIVRQQKEI